MWWIGGVWCEERRGGEEREAADGGGLCGVGLGLGLGGRDIIWGPPSLCRLCYIIK